MGDDNIPAGWLVNDGTIPAESALPTGWMGDENIPNGWLVDDGTTPDGWLCGGG